MAVVSSEARNISGKAATPAIPRVAFLSSSVFCKIRSVLLAIKPEFRIYKRDVICDASRVNNDIRPPLVATPSALVAILSALVAILLKIALSAT